MADDRQPPPMNDDNKVSNKAEEEDDDLFASAVEVSILLFLFCLKHCSYIAHKS